nr:RHS repeat-associated core domain-containing protein [Paenibacillus dendritiformis]
MTLRCSYAGEQFDPVTQQYYLRARFYNPVIARFTQEDEYRGDGLNLYAYVGNNPIRYVDPSGYSCEEKGNVYGKGDRKEGPYEETSNLPTKLRDTRNIRYSQDTISSRYSDNTNMNETIARLKADPSYAEKIEPIRIIKFDNLPKDVQDLLKSQGVGNHTVFSLDNRRLYTAKMAKAKINSRWATQSEIQDFKTLFNRNRRKKYRGKEIEICLKIYRYIHNWE